MSFHFLFVMLGYTTCPFQGCWEVSSMESISLGAWLLQCQTYYSVSSSAHVLRMMGPGSALSLLLPYLVPFSPAGERIPYSPLQPPKWGPVHLQPRPSRVPLRSAAPLTGSLPLTRGSLVGDSGIKQWDSSRDLFWPKASETLIFWWWGQDMRKQVLENIICLAFLTSSVTVP